ncbi:MAG: aminotransferase class IV [Solirubrobacteraceae bacterium]
MSNHLQTDRTEGVFETLLIVDGLPIELEPHLDRLRASVQELFGSELPADTRELVLERAASLALSRLRLTVAPGPDDVLRRDIATAIVDRATLFPAWERAIVLRPFVVPGGLGAHKWADRAALARMESSVAEGCLPLLLDAGGEVLEASRANVFAVEGEVLITPPADGRVLPGVARARAIDAAGSLGIGVREEVLTVDRLLAAGEAFLTGSVRGVEPVRCVDDAEFEPPGDAVGAIAAAMKRNWVGKRAARS